VTQPSGTTPTRTVGAAAMRNALADFVGKHAAPRWPVAMATMVADTGSGGLGLQIAGDPGYFPLGSWAWLQHEGLDPGTTQDGGMTTQPGGGDDHTHGYQLPGQLAPPALGEQVAVLWMDQAQQQPLVLGKIEWSH
jgi:hypothetical protein